MTRFSAPINPERPKGAPSCAKCANSNTVKLGKQFILVCDFGRYTDNACDLFSDASVERTERRGLKAGYDVARTA